MSRIRSTLLSSTAGGFAGGPHRPRGPVGQLVFYYTETFAYLRDAHLADIDRRLIDDPLALRARHLAPAFLGVEAADPGPVWEMLHRYLQQIEDRMAAIASRHSPAYWFHLYRRLAPVLSSRHGGKRDNTTVILVRQIAELAYLKHGELGRTDDLGWITDTNFSTFLGGTYKAAMSKALNSGAAARRQYEATRAVRQSVMLDFDVEDFLSAFGMEGLAYEYWKASAAMRSLGKGVRLHWDADAQWFADQGDGPDPLLFALFDHRIANQTGLATRLGTWTQLVADRGDFETVYFAAYNPNGDIEDYPVWDAVGRQIVYGRSRLNFHVGRAPLQAFLDGHAFMAPAFEKRHKVKLSAVIFCLQVAAFFAFFPDRAIFSKDENERNAIIIGNLTNLYYRGYKHIGQSLDTIAEEALWWAEKMSLAGSLDAADVRAGFEFLMLNEASAQLIGLWSGGKRPLILPVFNGLLIDAAAIGPILTNLFFGVREATGAKGFAFEDSVRSVLRTAGCDLVHHGEIEFAGGIKREIDAAVRIGDRLVLVECFSFERPVDFELARPGVFEARNPRIAEKIEQARSLADAIQTDPRGTNFDFSWAKTIDWRLATPLVEFAWAVDDDHFDDAGVPRILQLSELVRFLADGRNPAQPFDTALRAAHGRPRTGSQG